LGWHAKRKAELFKERAADQTAGGAFAAGHSTATMARTKLTDAEIDKFSLSPKVSPERRAKGRYRLLASSQASPPASFGRRGSSLNFCLALACQQLGPIQNV